MNEELILEADKTYVFKDDECREKYIQSHFQNKNYIKYYYDEGFNIQSTYKNGRGGIINCVNIIEPSLDEHRFFKLKEPSAQTETPSNEASEALSEELHVAEYNEISSKVHSISERYKLDYSYYHSTKDYLVDYKDLCYKITSAEELEKFEKMIIISEELLQC
jgi:hypothetical protein|tara:strand:+ start:207 stop:695 length:489 start_codon:yes stop_codon:yes gene_type:complete